MSLEIGRVNAFDREVSLWPPWRRHFYGPCRYVWIGDILPEIYGNPFTGYSVPLEPAPPPLEELPEIEEPVWDPNDGSDLYGDSEEEADKETPQAARIGEEHPRPRNISDRELMPPPPRPMGPSPRPVMPAAGEHKSRQSATRREDSSAHEEIPVVEEQPFVYVGSDPRCIERQLTEALSGKLRTIQLLCPCGEERAEASITCSNDDHEYETWYHLSCAGLSCEPPDKVAWYCAECVSNGYKAYNEEEALDPETDDPGDASRQLAMVGRTTERKTVHTEKSAVEANIQLQPSAQPVAKGKASAKVLPKTPPRQRQRSEGRPSVIPKSGPRTKGKPWTDAEESVCITLMKDIKTNTNLHRIDQLWELVSQRLKRDHNIDRSSGAVKNQWNRVLREKSGFDERAVKRPDMMRTGELASAKKRATTAPPSQPQVIKFQDKGMDNDSITKQTPQLQDYGRKRKRSPLEDDKPEEREPPQLDPRKRRRVITPDDEYDNAEEPEELPDVNPNVKRRTRFSNEERRQNPQLPTPTTEPSRKRRRETPVTALDDDNKDLEGRLSKPAPKDAGPKLTTMEEQDAILAAELQIQEYRRGRGSRSGSNFQGRQ